MPKIPYSDGDPLVLVKIINSITKKEIEVLAYVDTGSDSIALSRDIWLELDLPLEDTAPILTVGGSVYTYIALIDIEFLGNPHKSIVAVYQEVGDVLIGRAVLDEYKITFDGPSKTLEIE